MLPVPRSAASCRVREGCYLDSFPPRTQLDALVRSALWRHPEYSGGIAVKPISPRQPQDLRRFGVFAIVLFQALAFAVLPALDAVLEAGASSAVAHVEGEHGEHCDSGHSHLLCQLSRTVSLGFPGLIPIDLPLVFEATPDTPTANAWQRRPIPPGGSGPRAPPHA